jgi:hypothetical protein
MLENTEDSRVSTRLHSHCTKGIEYSSAIMLFCESLSMIYLCQCLSMSVIRSCQ